MPKRNYKRKKFKILSWRALDKRFRLKRKIRVLGLGILVVFATFATLASLYLIRMFKQPFVRAGEEPKISFHWEGNRPANFTWIVVDNIEQQNLREIGVLHLNPKNEEAVFIKLSSGRYNLSNGVSFVLSKVSKDLDLPIKGYFLVEQNALEEAVSVLGDNSSWESWGVSTLVRMPSVFSKLRSHFWSNLSLGEILKLGRQLVNLRADQCLEIKAEDISAPDLSGVCADSQIQTENLKILILNGTTVPGLAADAEKWLLNIGAYVLDVGNAPQQDYEKSLILTRDKENYTVRRLASELGISELKKLDQSLDWAKRADIVVILGLDKKGFF